MLTSERRKVGCAVSYLAVFLTLPEHWLISNAQFESSYILFFTLTKILGCDSFAYLV